MYHNQDAGGARGPSKRPMLWDMDDFEARFGVGEIIRHVRFGYRGVIIDVDPVCQASDEWYEAVARSRPPKDAPWYHVLVHDASHTTYVAERNLEHDSVDAPIRHPLLREFFDERRADRYVRNNPVLQ